MRTIGALDIQSTEPNMFDADDLPIFSTLANQVSIAIQNARLFEQAQSALKDAERLTRRLSGEAWSNVRQVHQTLGYRFDGKKSQALDNDARGQDKSKTTISIPVNLRGESIGTLKLISANPSRKWSEGELTIANTVVERVALALENIRLLEEAERRAAKERTISEGTSRVSKALDVESILQATAEELERALGSSEIVIQLTNEDGSGGPK
jgi:GAF domain-containing protein